MALNGTCPSCGAKAPLDHFLVEQKYKEALVAALSVPAPLAELTMRYLGLFAPPGGRAINANKLARIVGEFAELTRSAQVTRNRITHAAPLELWRAGLEATLAARDAGSLVLPLSDHHYLAEIVWRLAAKAAAGSERHAPTVSHPSHRAFEPGSRAADKPAASKKDSAAEAASLKRLIAAASGAGKTQLEAQLKQLEGADK